MIINIEINNKNNQITNISLEVIFIAVICKLKFIDLYYGSLVLGCSKKCSYNESPEISL